MVNTWTALEDYLHQVEHRHESRVSHLETIDRDTIQQGISWFQSKHGPFDAVTVEDLGEMGWKLTGRRTEQPDVFCAVPRPFTAQRVTPPVNTPASGAGGDNASV